MKIVFIVLVLLSMAGCDPIRHRPEQQVKDMEVCRKANMKAFLNGFNEVLCAPKEDEYTNFKDPYLKSSN